MKFGIEGAIFGAVVGIIGGIVGVWCARGVSLIFEVNTTIIICVFLVILLMYIFYVKYPYNKDLDEGIEELPCGGLLRVVGNENQSAAGCPHCGEPLRIWRTEDSAEYQAHCRGCGWTGTLRLIVCKGCHMESFLFRNGDSWRCLRCGWEAPRSHES